MLIQLTRIPFDHIPYLTKTDIDYQTGNSKLEGFYAYSPDREQLEMVTAARGSFNTDRALLTEVLREQYQEYPDTQASLELAKNLRSEDTFTMVTAHQPCLMTGPLYTVTKAISTIRAAQIASAQTGKQVIPVYIIGGEDHDFEEMNHFQLFNEKLVWENETAGGPVGRMNTDSLQDVLGKVSEKLGDAPSALALNKMIRDTHRPGRSYAVAYADLMHRLLGKYGLLVLLMDDPKLKRAFSRIMVQEIREQLSTNKVQGTQQRLTDAGYKAQAYVRELNLFYLGNGIRERILPAEKEGQWIFEASGKQVSTEELADICEADPYLFSPNVTLRPLYQEFILPNLAYIGGGGELAYWLERRDQFEAFGIPYPMLIRRDSILWVGHRDTEFLNEHGISGARLFESADDWIRFYLENNSDDLLDMESEKLDIARALDNMINKGAQLDQTLAKSLEAEKVRLMKSVEQVESRVFRAAKQKNDQLISKFQRVKEKLFPGNGLMERYDNFIPYYLRYGDVFFETLLEHLDPFDREFKVLLEEA